MRRGSRSLMWRPEAELQGSECRVCRRLLANDSVDDIRHHFTTASRGDHRQSMRLRLQLRQCESIGKRRQYKNVGVSVVLRCVRVSDTPEPPHILQPTQLLRRSTLSQPNHPELDRFVSQCLRRFKQPRDAFTQIDLAKKQYAQRPLSRKMIRVIAL